MNINEYMENNKAYDSSGGFNVVKRIVCKDGFSISVQANEFAYCMPRRNTPPWSLVEAGFPSEAPKEIMQYAEDPSAPTETVYPYVPVEEIEKLIESHGGLEDA